MKLHNELNTKYFHLKQFIKINNNHFQQDKLILFEIFYGGTGLLQNPDKTESMQTQTKVIPCQIFYDSDK